MKNSVIKDKRKFVCYQAVLILMASLFLPACNSDDIDDDALYTFTGETVASYCEKTDDLSLFSRIIRESGNYSLLSVYGHFTCFAPTDSAIMVYLKEKGLTFDELTVSDKVTIVNDHVINHPSKEFRTGDFQEGALSSPNMNDRYVVVSYAGFEEGSQVILVNKSSPILEKDIEVHNGLIHVVGKVVEPSSDYLYDVLKQHDHFSLFSQAFDLTNLADSIEGVYDESYVTPYPDGFNGNFRIPTIKKYGYTLFAETDEVFRAAGITNLEELVDFASRYYGTEDMEDFTSRNNPLNKFISYHLLDRQMSTSSFVYSGDCTAPNAEDRKYEYYETMLKHRLIEIKSGNQINTQQDGSYVGVNDFYSNNDGINGYVHALDNILVYDEDIMINDVLHKRLRFDIFAVPPAFTNNNLRWQLESEKEYTVLPGYCDDHLTFTEATTMTMWSNVYWCNFQADEILFKGWFDVTLRMLPVPPGTYEIRLGYNAESWRAVAQIFIDDDITGIPVNLTVSGPSPSVGWVEDAQTTDNGIENDKSLRNRGYMKGPASAYTQNAKKVLRDISSSLRVIVGTFTFQEYGPHYFRIKNVEDPGASYHFDYLEYVPVSHLDYEDRD